MKVLLINPPIYKSIVNVWKKIDSVTPPFGLMILGSILLEKGVDVQILDCNAEMIPLSGLKGHLPNEYIDYVGITATTALINNGLAVAGICRHVYPDAGIVMGGIHPTVLPDETFACGNVDFVIRGEGERSFPRLIEGDEPTSISGLSFRDGNKIVHNPRTDPAVDLDDVSMPAYHLLPMEKYRTALGSSRRSPNIGMIASRGCPGRCTYCYGNVFGKKIRFRSPEKIFNEIVHLQETYGIKEVAFYDDTFTTHKKKVIEFCTLLTDNKIDLTWSCFSRVDTVDFETLQFMREAGCHQISVGIESADKQILKNIRKNIRLSQADEMVRSCRKVGIDVRACFMFGNPGETKETLRKTIDYSKKLNPDIALYNITTPFPGSKMFDWAKEQGYLRTEDWREYDLARTVMDLPTITGEEIVQAYRSAYREFYLRPSYLLRRFFGMKSFYDVQTNWNAFKALFRFGS